VFGSTFGIINRLSGTTIAFIRFYAGTINPLRLSKLLIYKDFIASVRKLCGCRKGYSARVCVERRNAVRLNDGHLGRRFVVTGELVAALFRDRYDCPDCRPRLDILIAALDSGREIRAAHNVVPFECAARFVPR
jgi:hypothetical protein